MKKKLAALDVKVQIALTFVGLLLFGFIAHHFLVGPQSKKAASLATQVADLETQIAIRRRAESRPPTPTVIQTADVFRLVKAMPDQLDMPGIMLTISEVARQSGVRFDSISPQALGVLGNYRNQQIKLSFHGDFYALSDFLYRLRSLVSVRDGRLDASGRLFSVESVNFGLGAAFPQISAELLVNAFIYGSGIAPVAPSATPPATGTDSTGTTTAPDTAAPPPDGATAAGATP